MSEAVAISETSFASMSAGARSTRWALAAIVVVGAFLRVADAGRPFDHRLSNAWRAADYLQISRNFFRGSLNILYPQVDWNADSPGYVEMELPVLPWLGAAAGRLLGYQENYMRFFAAACSLATLMLFVGLVRRLLPPAGAVFAISAFAVNPLLIRLGNAMQPEPLMMLGCVATACAIERWRRAPSSGRLLTAALLLAVSVLAKAPAAAMGLVLAFALLREQGTRAFKRPINYLAAVVAVGPPLAWFLWAKQFWRLYGNSLGVSNESHWISWQMFTPPEFLWGILKWEALAVLTPIGWLLVLAATRFRRRGVSLAWAWYGAALAFYLVAGGTSGDDWASYYHCLSVPAACLLMGGGFSVLVDAVHTSEGSSQLPRGQWIGGLLGVGVIGMLAYATGVAIHRRDHHDELIEMRKCAMQLAEYVPASERILVRGGEAVDEFGRPVAYNEPMIFAWMDRKGFNYPRHGLTMKSLEQYRRRGARYWVARDEELNRDGLREMVASRFRKLADCREGAYELFDLDSAVDVMPDRPSDGDPKTSSDSH